MKKGIILVFVLSFLCIFSSMAFADFGPKPSIKITVINPPDEDYVFDLMEYVGDRNPTCRNFYNIDEDMFKYLSEYKENGWMSALSHDDVVGIGADLAVTPKGISKEFSYTYNVPSTFKVIIVTRSGKIQTSQTYKRTNFNAVYTYDYSQGKIVSSFSRQLDQFAVKLLKTFLLTIVIEGVFLIAFGLDTRKNWKTFLLVNGSTQLFLYVILIIVSAINPMFNERLVISLCEVVIIISETVIYKKYLEGKTKARRIGYSITANVISCFWAELLVFIALIIMMILR